MHVVIVTDYAYISGGQARVSIDSALGLVAAGHKVTYFAPCGPPDERLTSGGIDLVCLDQGDITNTPTLKFVRQIIWNGRAQSELAKILSGLDPRQTIVHVHGWAKSASASIAPPIIASGLQRIYTFHEYFLVCPNGGFYDFRKHEICHRTPMAASCLTTNCDSRSPAHKALRVLRQAIVNQSGFRNAFRHVIAISHMQRARLAPLLPSDTIWHHVDNPVDAHDFGAKPTIGNDFLFIGRLSPEKGVVHFLKASRLAGLRPLVAGEGPLREELEATFPEARFLGWQSADQARALMRSARAMVFPSVWMEGQPLTVQESLACGTPVIVSDACAGREAVDDGVNGLWFRSADEADLARTLGILQDDDAAHRMSEAAYRNWWADPLTLGRHIDRLESVYAAALEDRE